MMMSVHVYRSALLWNFLSTVFSGICGFIVLLIIGGVYGPITLGVFNQVYAFYIVFSQFGAFGIHLSLVKHLAEYDQYDRLRRIVFSSGVFLSLFIAFFWALSLWLGNKMIGEIFSRNVGHGVGLVSVGVFFFSLNKIMMLSLNGMSMLKEYAFFQSLRFLLMLIVLIFLILVKTDGRDIPLVFSIAEGALFLSLLVFCRHGFIFERDVFSDFLVWVRRHFFFGFKSFGGHILVLVNTRIDVLCLGLFLEDKVVGIYSMAAIVAEAACQLPTVFRTVYTPDIVKFVAERRQASLLVLVRKSRFFLWSAMLLISLAGYFVIELLLPVLTDKIAYREAAPLFAILMSGIVFSSAYMPFSFLLVNGGYPGMQSLMIFLVVFVNIVGNLLLIPFLGGIGAALATSFANICSVFILKALVRRCLGLKL